jgi:hypothetical protein
LTIDKYGVAGVVSGNPLAKVLNRRRRKESAVEWWALTLRGPTMSARFFCLTLLLAATSLFASAGALAQSVPPEAYRAKTVFIRNNAGGAQLENAADEELSKWGRFALADDEASADIILIFSKNGIQNTEKSDNKKDGTCCDTSYGASFSPGATARAYLKGHGPGPGSLPFWQDGCGGMTQKATGKGCIDAFKKQFPR